MTAKATARYKPDENDDDDDDGLVGFGLCGFAIVFHSKEARAQRVLGVAAVRHARPCNVPRAQSRDTRAT